jgi:hypothetical protein
MAQWDALRIAAIVPIFLQYLAIYFLTIFAEKNKDSRSLKKLELFHRIVNYSSLCGLLSTNVIFGNVGSVVFIWLIAVCSISFSVVVIVWQSGPAAYRLWALTLGLNFCLLLSATIAYWVN